MTAPVTALPPPTIASVQPAARKDKAAEAARMLEAYFLRQLMAEVRTTGEGGLLAPGFGGQMFHEMLDEALADRMAEAGGVGIAALVQKQLGEIDGAAPAIRPASTRALRTIYGAGSRDAAWHQALGQPIELEADKTWIMPVEASRLSSGFGKLRPDPDHPGQTRTHKGLDMIAPTGTPVRAARGGEVVVAAATAGGFGNLVVIDHGGGTRTFYGHLQSIDVRTGDRIEAGAPLGAVGSTGRSSAPHLHFEVRQDGESIDPTDQVQGLKFRETRTNR